jgi:hypothetical protein
MFIAFDELSNAALAGQRVRSSTQSQVHDIQAQITLSKGNVRPIYPNTVRSKVQLASGALKVQDSVLIEVRVRNLGSKETRRALES